MFTFYIFIFYIVYFFTVALLLELAFNLVHAYSDNKRHSSKSLHKHIGEFQVRDRPARRRAVGGCVLLYHC